MGIQITTNPLDFQFQNNVQTAGTSDEGQEIVIFEGQDIDSTDTLELNISNLNNNLSTAQPVGTNSNIKNSERIKALNAKLKNISNDDILTEMIKEHPYDENGKDIYGLTNGDYVLLCSNNPNLDEEMIKEFGARAAYFTEKSLHNLPENMEKDGFKKTNSQAEQEMLAENPYKDNGKDKFGKTEDDYYKMLEEFGYTREMIDATKLGARRAYFAQVQNMTNEGQTITPLKEVEF